MSNFVSRSNFTTCQSEWVEKDEEYDYHQEVARSAYGDMLHDTERNEMYEAAIMRAITKMHKSGRSAVVLDIGTGTGLLAMMALRHGADRVVACEAFAPVADCAEKVLEINNMDRNKITLIKSISHSLSENDIGGRANILVAEVFDTELIGEGALRTFKHAIQELLENDPIVIPSWAVLKAQPVACPFFRNFNTFRDVCLDGHNEGCFIDNKGDRLHVRFPEEAKSCAGLPSVHDVQLDNISLDMFKALSEPEIIFRFDFDEKDEEMKFNETKVVSCTSTSDGLVDCIFVWWELHMTRDDNDVLSVAPYWAHPDGHQKQWRDHWMQAVYYPKDVIAVKRGECFDLVVHHDEFSLWFDLADLSMEGHKREALLRNSDHHCKCRLHLGCSRNRLARLNDAKCNNLYLQALRKMINSESVCLSFNDNSLLPIMAAKLGARKVFVIQPESSPIFTESLVKANHLENKVKILDSSLSGIEVEEFDGETINTIIGEPFFHNSILPWEDCRFLYVKGLLDHLSVVSDQPLVTKDLKILPQHAHIRGVAMEFKDLIKVKGAKVGTCQGFNLLPFDEMVSGSSQFADSCIESYPLWEYPGNALTPEIELLNLDLVLPFTRDTLNHQEREGYIDFRCPGTCNGIAIWVDYNFNEDNNDMIVKNGPVNPVVPGEGVQWNPHLKQGVFFLPKVEAVDGRSFRLKHRTVLDVKTTTFSFDFSILEAV